MNIKNLLLNLKADSDDGFTRPIPIFWFVTIALVAPFFLLTTGGKESNNLPWYFWSILLMLMLTVISAGFLRFTRESRKAVDISISPDRH